MGRSGSRRPKILTKPYGSVSLVLLVYTVIVQMRGGGGVLVNNAVTAAPY
jgi:hypothetical protein